MNLNVSPHLMRYMYADALSVERSQSITNDDGSEGGEYRLVPELSNVPCHYSVTTPHEIDLTADDKNMVLTKHTLFLPVEHKILAGDHLTVMHKGNVIKLTAPLPEVFDVCQQLVVIERRNA